jgi:caa(3)-type oxidase subunit IV
MSGSDHGHSHGHDAHHHDGAHGPSHYIRIWVVLLVLLVISITGPMLEIPAVTLVTAFGIAGVKAFLVMKHFMHLDRELPLVRYILTTSVVFMIMFFAATAVDVMNHEGARWTNDAAKRAIAEGMAYGDPAAHHAAHDAAHGGSHDAPASHEAPASNEAPAAGGH